MFKDKTLLITGGTGSFGNAVLDRFLNTDIREIRIFSRDEKNSTICVCIETKPFEFAKDVDSGEDVALYLSIFLEENGVQGLIEGLKHLAKAKGMNTISNDTGVNRQSLYRSLAKNSNPTIETIDKVIRALGFRLTIEK